MKFNLKLKPLYQGVLVDPRDQVWHVMLNGKKFGELYYNMTGFTGCYLPGPRGGCLLVGEKSISVWRRHIAALNREARNPSPVITGKQKD